MTCERATYYKQLAQAYDKAALQLASGGVKSVSVDGTATTLTSPEEAMKAADMAWRKYKQLTGKMQRVVAINLCNQMP